MQHFKTRMTKLKHLIERFPEQGDINGFAGITRSVLLTAVDTAYELSQHISDEDRDNQFIIIALKRQSATFYNKYKLILDSESELPEQTGFDDFVDDLSELIEKTKSVYFICHSGTEQAAVELAGLKSDVEAFKKFKESYSAEYESAKFEVAALKELRKEAALLSKETVENHDAARSASDSVKEIAAEIENAGNNTDKWVGSIEKCATDLKGMREDFAQMKSSVETTTQEAQKINEQSSGQLKSINENLSLSDKLLEESKLTLANANRHSMAASFEARKNELLRPMALWGSALVIALACIALVILLGPDVEFAGAAWGWISPILVRMSLIAPCVWLGWYAGRQYGYTVRIREDYSFKYACAVAYEGFKKAADGENSRLGQILLELCMLNMSQQPLRVYAQSKFGVKGLPVEDLLETVKGKLPHLDTLDLKYGNMTLSAKIASGEAAAKEETECDG